MSCAIMKLLLLMSRPILRSCGHMLIAQQPRIYTQYSRSLRAATRKAAIELVPRGNRLGTERLIEKAVLAVKSGERLGWGGEGRISGQDGAARFKVGASLVAIRSQAPIIPMMIYGGHRLLPLGSIRARPGEIHIRFGEPILTTGLDGTDARDLADKAQAATAAMYAEFKVQDEHAAR